VSRDDVSVPRDCVPEFRKWFSPPRDGVDGSETAIFRARDDDFVGRNDVLDIRDVVPRARYRVSELRYPN
jgi:hypothetical protein